MEDFHTTLALIAAPIYAAYLQEAGKQKAPFTPENMEKLRKQALVEARLLFSDAQHG